MNDNRYFGHTVTRLSVHIAWVTKYRYKVLIGDLQQHCRELLIQICDSEDVRILGGVVSGDHVHMHIEYPPSLSLSNMVKSLKNRSSRLLQKDYPELKRRYWGKHLWGHWLRSLEYRKHNGSNG